MINTDKLLLTFKEAAEYTGIGITSLRYAYNDGKLDDAEFKVGSKVFLKREKLKEYIDKNNSL